MERTAADRLRSVLSGTVDTLGELKGRAGLFTLNRPGSTAAAEVAAETPVASIRPVTEAYSFADLRVAAAAEQTGTLATLLHESESVFSSATIARTAIENSARAAWLMETRIDGAQRGHRALADLFESRVQDLRLLDTLSGKDQHATEEDRAEFEEMQSGAERRFDEMIVALEEAGILTRSRAGKPIGVRDTPWPTATDVITAELGIGAFVAWKQLSGIAHGSPTALVRQTQPIARDAGTRMRVVQAWNPISAIVPRLATVYLGMTEPISRMVELRGWDRIRWQSWTVEASREIGRLLHDNPSPRSSPEPEKG